MFQQFCFEMKPDVFAFLVLKNLNNVFFFDFVKMI